MHTKWHLKINPNYFAHETKKRKRTAFYTAIDNAKVDAIKQANHTFNLIVGGHYKNHCITIKGLSKQDIDDTCNQKDDAACKLDKAVEVKVAIIVV